MWKYIALALAASCSPAMSATSCDHRDQITQKLTDNFGETQSIVGLTSGGNLFEMFTNDTTGTWTVVLTNPNMVSCVMTVGTAFDFTATTNEEPNL